MSSLEPLLSCGWTLRCCRSLRSLALFCLRMLMESRRLSTYSSVFVLISRGKLPSSSSLSRPDIVEVLPILRSADSMSLKLLLLRLRSLADLLPLRRHLVTTMATPTRTAAPPAPIPASTLVLSSLPSDPSLERGGGEGVAAAEKLASDGAEGLAAGGGVADDDGDPPSTMTPLFEMEGSET